MNNLHRELAPISDAAWAQIEEETTRTLKRYLAGRRVVDVPSPGGVALPGVGTGHLSLIAAPEEGIVARQRETQLLSAVLTLGGAIGLAFSYRRLFFKAPRSN